MAKGSRKATRKKREKATEAAERAHQQAMSATTQHQKSANVAGALFVDRAGDKWGVKGKSGIATVDYSIPRGERMKMARGKMLAAERALLPDADAHRGLSDPTARPRRVRKDSTVLSMAAVIRKRNARKRAYDGDDGGGVDSELGPEVSAAPVSNRLNAETLVSTSRRKRQADMTAEIESSLNAESAAAVRTATAALDVWTETAAPSRNNAVIVRGGDWAEHLLDRPNKRARTSVVRPTSRPGVAVPAGGVSYRPEPEAHQDLLGEALAQELAQRAEEARYARILRRPRHVPRLTADGRQRDLRSSDTSDSDADSDVQGEVERAKDKSRKLAKSGERKVRSSAKASNKLAHGLELRARRQAKRQAADLDRLQHINAELAANESQQAGRAEFRAQTEKRLREEHGLSAVRADGQQERRIRVKAGKEKFTADPITVLTTDELPDNLRHTALAHDPVRERFMSLQERHMIEVTHRSARRQRYAPRFVQKKFGRF